MKLYNKLSLLMLGAVALVASCDDIDDQNPMGGLHTAGQIKATNTAVPSRSSAIQNGLYSMMGAPNTTFGSNRADDFGYIAFAFSQDIEGADVVVQNNDYNWFSAAAEMTSRDPSYANPYMRYKLPYSQVGVCNELISGQEEGNAVWAQAKAMRAFAYSSLAPYFAFGVSTDPKALCVPILLPTTDYSNNPRATVEEVYDYILTDLTEAIEAFEKNKFDRGADKSRINLSVAYGLRARTYLALNRFAEAAADAEKALAGYTPASRDEVSVPSFFNMSDHNWIWAIDITDDQLTETGYPTSSSWISSFSGNGYAAATGSFACINVLLYNKIPATDVRKGWWLDEDLHSPLLEGQTWSTSQFGTAVGQDIATFEYDDKLAFLPYTNVKFGMNAGIGSTTNNNDWCLMRAEEMILIQAEGYAKSGNEAKAKEILSNFVKTYRDPSYDINGRGLSLADEIWFQRRVELWCEGFYTSDMKRLGKPLVRFHAGEPTNWPDAFAFNMAANDGWLNMRFSQYEINNNKGIVDNTDGSLPVPGQNGNLRDGVTD